MVSSSELSADCKTAVVFLSGFRKDALAFSFFHERRKP